MERGLKFWIIQKDLQKFLFEFLEAMDESMFVSEQLPVYVNNWARLGYLKLLKWGYKYLSRYYSYHTYSYAAVGGHLEVLQWLRATGAPWSEETCAWAASNGHLEILQWARANDAPWDEWTCAYAVMGGHLEVLQWAIANGCHCDWLTLHFAREHKRVEIIDWLHTNVQFDK